MKYNFNLTDSMEWVAHERGHSTELVRKREKEGWDYLFDGAPPQYIVDKFNDILPLSHKAVIVPARSIVLVLNPYDPEELRNTLQSALSQVSASYDVALAVSEGPVGSIQVVAPPPRQKRPLLKEENESFFAVFGDLPMKNIQDLINIKWLRDDLKIFFIKTQKEIVVLDNKEPLTVVTRAQQLLKEISSGFGVTLVEADSTKYSLMEAV